jgi:hypothetical protein
VDLTLKTHKDARNVYKQKKNILAEFFMDKICGLNVLEILRQSYASEIFSFKTSCLYFIIRRLNSFPCKKNEIGRKFCHAYGSTCSTKR